MVHRLLLRQVSAQPEASDAITWYRDPSAASGIHPPAAFGGNDEIVGRWEEEIRARIEESLQRAGVRLEVRHQRGIGLTRRVWRSL
jgi:hypothetical protein